MTDVSSPAAEWTEVRVLVPRGWEELVADVLAEASGTAVAFGAVGRVLPPAPNGMDWVRTALTPSRASASARRALTDSLAALAGITGEPELGALEVSFRPIPTEDWANAWKKTWKPFRVGRVCVVSPHRSSALRADDVRLELVPGGTFGTGRHATTRACLQLVQERVSAGERVLDAGTGTGILAVASALFGASLALGFDVDPSSEPFAVDLARRNGVADRCRFRTGGFEVLDEHAEPFDGVFANLYSDLIQRHAGRLAERLRSGGWCVFSGCPEMHLEPTYRAIETAGFSGLELSRRGRWCTVSGWRS
jgi:ribosomal protein L11 methyltransferase